MNSRNERVRVQGDCCDAFINPVSSLKRWSDAKLILLRIDWKRSTRDAESSPTENSSLRKHTNLDSCCYGNQLVEFHHQSKLAGGNANTLRWLANSSSAHPAVGYLLPLRHPSVFLSSHIVKSPMGAFFLLPHHLCCSFSLLLGERGGQETEKWA